MSNKIKIRNDSDKKSFIKKLNIIEGQVRGVKQMIEEDRYCDDVLIQISAINKSLKAIGNSILKEHIGTCFSNDIKNNNYDSLDELMSMISRLN